MLHNKHIQKYASSDAVLKEFYQYESLKYGNQNEVVEDSGNTSGNTSDITSDNTNENTDNTAIALSSPSLLSKDRYHEYQSKSMDHEQEISNGVACMQLFVENAMDVKGMHQLIFQFKNTLEIAVQITLDFTPHVLGDDGKVPTHNTSSKQINRRLNPLETYDFAKMYRYADCDDWVVSHYNWSWTPAAIRPAAVIASNAAAVNAVIGPQLNQLLPNQQNNPFSTSNNTAAATLDNSNSIIQGNIVVTNPIAEEAAAAARNRPRSNSDEVSNNNNGTVIHASSSSSSSTSTFVAGGSVADSDKVAQLMGMGFPETAAKNALITYNNNLESACNHLLGM